MDDLDLIELEEIFYKEGNIKIRAYYRFLKLQKIYYDFEKLGEKKLNGLYELLEVQELIFYISEENYNCQV